MPYCQFMLTLPQTVDVHSHAAAHKLELLRTPWRFLVSAMLAGMWIGVGDVLMWSAGAQFFVQDNPATKLVAGSVFAAALTIVVFAGSELATSAMMILPIGALRGAISWSQAGFALVAVFFGNMIGSFVFAWVMIQTGLLKTGASHDYWSAYLTAKIEHTPAELFWRGVMCNVLVSCAIWAAARLKSEAGRAIIIFWCVLGFVASGFEHVVANMTTFAIGLLGGGVDVTWGDFGLNMLTVGAGNVVGGGIVIGLAYAFVAGKGGRQGPTGPGTAHAAHGAADDVLA